MQRFRSTWIALIGGALLITLSVSAAFGAAPANTREATRGQTIAAFVHELVFGADEAPEDEAELEEEDLDEEDADALQDPEHELDDEETAEADAHGECVSEVAQDAEAVGGVNENHGGAVSEAARITCWDADEDPELADPEEDEEDEEDLAETDTHGACVSAVAQDKSAVGGKNDNRGGAVSEAARETCRDDAEDLDEEAALDEEADELDEASVEADQAAAKAERAAAKEAAKADRGTGKPTWAATSGGNTNAGSAKAGGNGNGGGNGRGGGRP
jgi:hypothetical protein